MGNYTRRLRINSIIQSSAKSDNTNISYYMFYLTASKYCTKIVLALLVFGIFFTNQIIAADCIIKFENNFTGQVAFSSYGCADGDDVILNNINDKDGNSAIIFDTNVNINSLVLNYKNGSNPMEIIVASGSTLNIATNMTFNVNSATQQKYLTVEGVLNVGGTLDLGEINIEIDGEGTISANEITGASRASCSGSGTCPTISAGTCSDGNTDGTGFCSSGDVTPLPIQLLYLQAKTIATGIQVNWASASEINFSHYLVERSTDGGKTFRQVAELKADSPESQVKKEYAWLDKAPFYGANYYRLRAVDIDGSEELHGLTMAYAGTKGDFRVSPNPSKNGIVKLSFPGVDTQTTLTVMNIQGSPIMKISLTDVDTILPISAFAPGTYILQAQNQFETKTTRLVVQ